MQSIVSVALLGGLRVRRPMAPDTIVDVRDSLFEMLGACPVGLMGMAAKACRTLIICTKMACHAGSLMVPIKPEVTIMCR